MYRLSSLLCDEFHHSSRDFALFTSQKNGTVRLLNTEQPFRYLTPNKHSAELFQKLMYSLGFRGKLK